MATAAETPRPFISFLKDALALIGALVAVTAILLNFANIPALDPFISHLPFPLPKVTPAEANTLFMWGTALLSVGLGTKTDGLASLISSLFLKG